MLYQLHGPFLLRNFPIFMETPEQDVEQQSSCSSCPELQLETNFLKWCTVHVYELVLQERMAAQASAHPPSCTCVTFSWCSLSWLLGISSSTLLRVWPFQSHLPPNSTSKCSYLHSNSKYHPPIAFFLPCKQNKLLSCLGTNHAGPMRLKTVLKNKCSISSGFSA